jgi:hypothetical protein
VSPPAHGLEDRHATVRDRRRIIHSRAQSLEIAFAECAVDPLELFRVGASFFVGRH